MILSHILKQNLILKKIMSETTGFTNYTLITGDNKILYRSFDDVQFRYLYDYFRRDSIDKDIIDEMNEVISLKTSKAFQIPFLQEKIIYDI